MRYRLKKWLLCVFAMTLFGGISSWASQEHVQTKQVEENENQQEDGTWEEEEEPSSEEEPVTEDSRLPTFDAGGKPAEEETGRSVPKEPVAGKLPDWLSGNPLLMLAAGFGVGLAAALAVSWICRGASGSRKKGRKAGGDPCHTEPISGKTEKEEGGMALGIPVPASMPEAADGTVGTVHHIGRRKSQQDTFGMNLTGAGLLAVVSDGMGGLADSDKVSQRAVMGMLQAGTRLSGAFAENPLFEMLSMANEQVLDMLGPDQIYKSGATLLAVLVTREQFHWAAVGDSRIYLYCRGHLFQINREHIYKQELVQEAVNRNISFSRVSTDPQRDRLVSFLGMGELKYIDGSLRPVGVKHGDKLLLMSDGIFNTISEQEILGILENTDNAAAAAALMEQKVTGADNPKQDNFTCVILDF